MRLTEMFRPRFTSPQVGDRVKNKENRKLGTVEGRSKFEGKTKVWAITVKYDDGTTAFMVPENVFMKVDRRAR